LVAPAIHTSETRIPTGKIRSITVRLPLLRWGINPRYWAGTAQKASGLHGTTGRSHGWTQVKRNVSGK
jgi:hypothetical protein